MNVSDRIAHLTAGGPDGWDLFRKARRMIGDGHPVIDLTIGEHDRRTDPGILEAMHASAMGGHTGYATLPGTDALRDAIARRTQERTGVPTSRANVVVTPGGQAALFAAHLAACDPGDTALFIDPYYATYPGTIRGTGARAVPVPAAAANGFRPAPADIDAAAARTGARSLLVNSPNNPTGVVYDRATLDGLAGVALARDLWVISDEVYDCQHWTGRHFSPRQIDRLRDRTLVVGSLSKSHAMTGSRLGWLIGPEEAIAHVINLNTHTTYGVPGFIQDAGLYALAQGPALEDRIAAPFRRRHEAVSRLLAARGIAMAPSTATMYLMVDIRPTGLTGEAFATRLLDDAHVAVMPGESFGTQAAGHLRIALTAEDSRLIEATTRLADLIDTLRQEAA